MTEGHLVSGRAEEMTEGHKETLEGVVCVHYLDYGNGFTNICRNLSNCIVYFGCGKFIVHSFTTIKL